jgi:hypothetical protein
MSHFRLFTNYRGVGIEIPLSGRSIRPAIQGNAAIPARHTTFATTKIRTVYQMVEKKKKWCYFPSWRETGRNAATLRWQK